MQTKIFLTSLLATFLAVGVTATPASVKARDVRTDHIVDFSKVANSVGSVKPPPKGQVITPKDNDVPVVGTSVKARDLESLEKRTAGCLYVTQDANFSGPSAYLCPIATNGGCTDWTNTWRYTISSFGPDPGTTCQIYTDPNCGGTASVAFGYPGYGKLGGWNDNMGSFRCWW
ncbi:hypothetical protein B9Z19DRAFT_1103054 [Tuber borchii]|uniref:Uncharacterized protein n=1 Tax=Tuber borchii TaxID=42251 RepID=A0A2T6ZIA2_TUBBO|nr:hypothetical protein B9Z19DRAFT_1103054 [Tuber borchii]